MPNYQGRGQPFPQYRRINTAHDPRLKRPIPAIEQPVENADAVLEKQIVTLNRAGSNPRNPVLKGLGFHLTMPVGGDDRLTGLYIYTRQAAPGANLAAQTSVEAPGVHGYEFLVGSGRSKAGDKDTGAIRNFVHVDTALGSYERMFYAQDKEADIVTLNGEAALDADTLLPVEIEAEIVDGDRPWLEVLTDFFVSWSDAFQVLNQRNDADVAAGYSKSNGGAIWVSFFDKTPGTEGVGVQVNPVTQGAIENRRKIEIQNTVGLKEITARFRSKLDSVWFVDVPLKIRVVDNVEVCLSPETEPCTDLYLKVGAAARAGLPTRPSVPNVQVVAGPDATIPADLLLVTILGATVGGAPKLRVRKLKWVASSTALIGARFAQVGSDQDYLPLIETASSPAPGAPYGAPKQFTIAFSVSDLAVQDVAVLQIVLMDGVKPGMPVLVPATNGRSVATMPISSGGRGTGGGARCSGY